MVKTSSWCSPRLLWGVLLLGIATSVVRAQAPNSPAASPSPAAGAAPASATPPAPKLETPEPPDRVVLKVGDQQFTKADIDRLIANLSPQAQQQIAARGKKFLGDQYSVVVLLSQQAHLHHLDQTPAFAQRLEFQTQQLEAQAAFEEINQQAKVTPEEVQQYYTAHLADYDEITVRQVVIRKKAPDPQANKDGAKQPAANPSSPAVPGLVPEAARERAEAIRKELLAGTDIKKIMAESAPGDVNIDAEPRKFRRGQGMRPEMEKVAFALKDGEVSEPVDLPMALLLFQVIGHSHADLNVVTPDIEKIVRQRKVDAAMDAVKKGTPVWMDEQYFAPSPKPQQGPSLSPAAPAAVIQKPNP